MAKQESFNTYCYDMVVSKICGGVEKTLLSSKEDKDAVTINNWSPNNVRRLIISPSGFIVQYYTTARNSVLLEKGFFNNLHKLNLCFASDDYKPMMRALTDIRVCSCVEELVYLTEPNRGMYLPLEELRVTKFNTGFKRLHARVFLEMTLKDFVDKFAKDLVKPDFQLCEADLDGIPKARIQLLAKDWWRNYPLRQRFYSLDADSGRLNKYFSKLDSDMAKSISDKKISDVKKKLLGDKVESLVKSDRILGYAIKGAFRYKSLLEKGQDNIYSFLSDEYRQPVTLFQKIQSAISSGSFTLGDLGEISELNKTFLSKCSVSFVTVDNFDGSEGDLYIKTKEGIDMIVASVYSVICEYMLDNLNSVAEEAPLTVEYLLRNIERVILVPKKLERKTLVIYDLCGINFEGKSIKHSICNCFLVCSTLCFISSDRYNKEYWLKMIGGER